MGSIESENTMNQDDYRELDLQVAELHAENSKLRAELEQSKAYALYLRHALEHIHAKAYIATQPPEEKEHDDKCSY